MNNNDNTTIKGVFGNLFLGTEIGEVAGTAKPGKINGRVINETLFGQAMILASVVVSAVARLFASVVVLQFVVPAAVGLAGGIIILKNKLLERSAEKTAKIAAEKEKEVDEKWQQWLLGNKKIIGQVVKEKTAQIEEIENKLIPQKIELAQLVKEEADLQRQLSEKKSAWIFSDSHDLNVRLGACTNKIVACNKNIRALESELVPLQKSLYALLKN